MPHHITDKVKNKPEKENSGYKPRGSYEAGRKKKPKRITPSYLHNSGLYYLERFAASKSHFKDVMLRKVKRSCMHHKDQDYGACAKMVDDLANKFVACQLLNDEVFAKAFAASLRRKGLSRRVTLLRMQNKGISNSLASDTLETLDSEFHETYEDAELAAALKLAKKKKIGPYFVEKKPDAKKALGVLARAGFSYDISRRVIDMKKEEMDELI